MLHFKKAETMTKPRKHGLAVPRLGWLIRGEARMTYDEGMPKPE